MKSILIGGFFDEQQGRSSGYISKLVDAFTFNNNHIDTVINGGTYQALNNAFLSLKDYQIIYWFVDVSNDLEKYLPLIKQEYPKAYLISSKYNQGRYSILELMQRALSAKANLLIEFNKKENQVVASVYDPLCNCYCHEEANVEIVAKALIDRVTLITSLSRIRSISIDNTALVSVPNHTQFFEIVKNHSKTYSELIQGINPQRFLGNCSFRCEAGFPSFRMHNYIYVSRRNCNKDMISSEHFVIVDLNLSSDNQITYLGEHKPSVDTPIQVALYRMLPHINYMLHSHVYIKDAPFTSSKLPCGSLEEVKEIMHCIENNNLKNNDMICVNLKGHGSLVLSKHLDNLADVQYIARQQPEI